jgi:branched-chain amino acid transport system substrate-binding protein
VFKGIVQAGLDVPTATTDGNMTYAQMKNYADFLPKQLYIASAAWAGYGYQKLDPKLESVIKEFYDQYAAIGQKPDLPASIGWNSALIVVDALKKLGPKAKAEQLRDYLVNLKGVPSIDGILDFPASPQRGLGLQDVVVTRWDPAKHTWVAVSQPGGQPLK